MDLKSEIKIKDEPIESREDGSDGQSFEQDSGLEEIQKTNLFPNIDSEEKFKIKNEVIYIKVEKTEDDEIPEEQTSDLDESESFIGNVELEISRSGSEMSKNQNEMIEKSDSEGFRCTFCNLCFKDEEEFKTHLETHCIKTFKCNQCKYECLLEKNLKNHLLKHTTTKYFKCPECSYQCKRKDYLKQHMLIHAKFKLFKCTECSYECNIKRDMKTHTLAHANIKLCKCSQCGSEFKRKDQLKAHMLTHTKSKLFKCSDCNYGCNRKGSLKRHMLTHVRRMLERRNYDQLTSNRH